MKLSPKQGKKPPSLPSPSIPTRGKSNL